MAGEPRLAGAVLCGGASTRMGADKASLMLDGATLIDRAVARLRTVAAPVIIASGGKSLTRPDCLTVDDVVPDAGPLAGVVAALEASPERLLAVVAVDMPDFDPALLLQLAQRCTQCDAVVPLSARGPEPLHAVYARSSLPALYDALASPDRSMRGSLERIDVHYVEAAALGAEPGFARNLNTPADVSAWSGRPRHVS